MNTKFTGSSSSAPRFSRPRTEQRKEIREHGAVSPVVRPATPSSCIHFLVHPGMREVQALAQARGWIARGFTTQNIAWMEVHWTVDKWRSSHVLRSTDVPCPIVNGVCHLPNVAKGTEVEFAVRVGVSARAAHDTSGGRETHDLWFNNLGGNYTQTTK